MDWEMRAASLILCLGILLATIQNGIAERKIICYYTNWSVYRPGTAKFSPQNINPYLCTHLIYAFGGFTKDNTLKPFDKYQDIEKGGYAKFTGLKTYNKNLKTMLAIGGWNEGSSRFSPMVADPARRREFVKNAVKFLRQNHFDGLDLDWEYPAFRDGGKPRDKDNYANLVQELREEFEREASKTGRPRLLLSMAMPAGIEYIDKGYDVPRLNEYLDFINLLSYDYHSAYEPAVNHHSPLYPLEEDNEYNYDAELTIDYTINYLLEKSASPDKVILGIPTYGRSYTLFNQEATELGSPADGPGVEGEATREKGYLAYYEICENIAESSDKWEVVQPNPRAMGPYAFSGNQWVGYDDEDIVRLKAQYVNEKKLGGIMFWSLDNDDFRGKCHGRPYPLIEAAKEVLLTNNRNALENTKSVDSRKKFRTQNNARTFGTNSQRSSTTSAPITRRVSSSRPKYRHISKSKTNDEEDREVSRRSYDPSSDEDVEGKNTVRVTEKTERPKNRNRSKTRNSSSDHSSRRKQSRRKGQSKTDENQESLSNKLTTPEPPTTPDPGTDFKCEDEGFFPHPRDCKKYFWCLDSGPSGLGVVAHQFTCPSGLVFNKGADSCDYPRNVICPKTSKTSVVSTTRSPITAATSRTTYLHSTTTAKAESEEYDSEEEDYEEDEVEEIEEEEEEVKEEPKTTTTMKPLVYKTLTRNRPSTTTTTTTTTTKPSESDERTSDSEDEEDPRVIKELIDLIRKAGGIEQLEKQLLLQEKNSDVKSGSESVTPATISRSLYERVLNRQTNRFSNGQRPVLSSSENSYVNGPGRAQFEGLDDIPEVKSLRRSQKPEYVTIERSKSATKESSENEEVDENEEDDSTDVASSEEESISNPLERSSSTQRVTPNYVNIRRSRPSTTTSKIANDVEKKEAEVEEERPARRRRPYVSKQQSNANSDTSKSSRNHGSSFRNSEKGDDSADNLSTEKNDTLPTISSRYSNIQRIRGSTPTSSENLSSVSSLDISTLPTKLEEVQSSTTDSTTTVASTTPTTTTSTTSTEVITVIGVSLENPSSVSPKANNIGSTTNSIKLVDSTADILTLPATTPSTTTTKTTTASANRSTIATVSQPRPFGFSRRRFTLSETAATTTTTTSAPSSRFKVADSKAIRLPTLKELIGYPTTYYYDDGIATTPSSALLHLLRNDVDNDISQQNAEEISFQGTSELMRGGQREESARDIIGEETGDSWLREVSESKARSRTPKRVDATLEERALVTNVPVIRGDDDRRKNKAATSMYLRPTTMRGISLVSLTSTPLMRGFYVTRSEDDPPSSTLAVDFASPYTTIDSPIERQTETASTPDTSTTDETVSSIIDNNDTKRIYRRPSRISSTESTKANELDDSPIVRITQDTHKRNSSLRSRSESNDEENDKITNITVFRRPTVNRELYDRTSSTVIVTHNNRDELKFDNNINKLELDINNINKSKDVDNHEEKSFTFDSSENSSENPSNYTELDTIRIPVSRSTSKREKLLLNFDYNTTPFSNVSPTTSTKRRIAIALSKYNEASIPLWTGKRIVPRKRNRTAVSSIKEAERRIDETDFPHTTKSVFKSVSATSEISSTIPSIVPESTTSPGILDVYSNFAYSTDSSKTEDSKNHTNAKTATLTNSVTTATPSISKIKNDFTSTVTSTISDDFISVTTMPATANESIIMTTPSSTIEVAKAPVIASDRITIKSVTKGVEIEIPLSMTANYSAADVSTTTNTHAIANDSVIIPATTSAGVEITSPIANYSTDFTNTIIPATVSAQVKITNYSVTAVPINTSTNAIVSDSDVVTTAPAITIGTGIETTPTVAIPTATNTHEIDIDSTVVTTTNEIETTITDHPAFVISTNTVIPDTSTIISPTHATIPATTSNLVDVDSITVTNMPITTIPTTVITPTIDDSNVITSVNASVSSITDISTTTSLPETSSAIFVTSAGEISRNSSAVPTTLTVESTTAHFNLNVFNISNNSEVSAVTTAKSIQTTEIPTTFETSSIFTSTVTSRSLPSINFTMSSTPSTLFSIVTPVTNIASVEKSTLSAIHDESTATNTIIQIQTTSTYNPSSVQTTSEKSTTPKIKITSEEAASRTIQRKQDQTSKLDDQIGQKTPRRRVLNRKNNWLGRPVVQQTINQYPRHRVTLHRGRPQRPPGYTSRVIETNLRRRVMQRRTRVNFESISSTIKPEESTAVVQNTTENHVADNRARNLRRKIVSRVRKNFQNNFSTNFVANKNFSDKGRTGRRIRVLLKRFRSKSEENNFTIPETSANIINENLQSNLSNNLSTSKNLSHEQKPGRRMRIVLRRVRPKFEEEEKVKIEEASRDSRDESLQGAFSNNFRSAKNFLTKTRRKVKIVLKSIKPKSEEKNSTAKEMDSDSADEEDLQGSFSSNIHTSVNLFDEEGTRKSIKSEDKDSVAEETMHSDFTDNNFSSNLHAGDNREKMITHFKYGRKEATIERPEDPEELQTTETFALAEENTDQPSLEVNSLKNSGYISRKSGHSNIIRQRKPIRNHSTTAAPLINSFPSTVAIYRSGRPVETTFSSRIDLVDAVEDTRPISMQNDQRADVSDQSIRAQEFAVALADPPLSSSDTGRTASRDATIRKISTTVAPRTDPTIYRTISRYNEDFRNRQRPKMKSARPTANATTRPRRPPVLDYDYYEDEVPIVVAGTSVLNSKLFLTSKGTIRCLDQGNFPHPYSCKKFITCARMVNGQVIGTEYTCPDKLTFDPIGGICNWSVGLCTDRNSY